MKGKPHIYEMNSSWGYQTGDFDHEDEVIASPLGNTFRYRLTVPQAIKANLSYKAYSLHIVGDFEERSTHIVK